MKISSKSIGNNFQCFIIAEGCDNHMGDLEVAKEMSRLAKISGADAIKLQTYTADTITLDSNKDDFKIEHGTIWDGQNLYDLYNQNSIVYHLYILQFCMDLYQITHLSN